MYLIRRKLVKNLQEKEFLMKLKMKWYVNYLHIREVHLKLRL